MVTIFTRNFTNRHNYIFSLIFGHWLNTDWRHVQREDEFNSAGGILIWYDVLIGGRGTFIKAAGLLDEQNIISNTPEIKTISDVPYLFPHKDPSSVLSFDIFSAIFWMVSRYEEYLPFEADMHGRFGARQSFAFRNGFHKMPVVDIWLMKFIKTVQETHPEFTPTIPSYSFTPTYDIDQAWAYLNKPALRCWGTAVRNIMKGRSPLNREQAAVRSGQEADPFDTYDLQMTLHEKYGLSPVYFIHPGTYGRFDKNIPLKNDAMRKLIHRLKERSQIGLHASYRSASETGLLKKELERLSEVTGEQVTLCRNHFLKICIPQTYRNYIACGITDDYTLGWSGDCGFRAGTGRNFLFYDLLNEQETSLMIHPFAVMEGEVDASEKFAPGEALREILKMIQSLKENGGTFISLWHNHSLGSLPEWKGWKEMYEEMIIAAMPGNEPEQKKAV